MSDFEVFDIDFYDQQARKDLECPKHDGLLDISGYSVLLGMYRAKWARFLYKEEQYRDHMQQVLNTVYAERYKYYLYDYEYTIDKKDIPILIKSDSEYKKAEKLVNEQTQKVKFITEVLGALNSQSFYLNTAMKHILWKSGETA